MKKILKKIYKSIPFKKEVFILLKKLWSPPESIYKHLHFEGVINVKIDKSHSFKLVHYGYSVENDIFWAGLAKGWEKNSLLLWMELCKHSNVIFDIGANTGVYSMIAKTINKEASVYAFEPVKRVFKKLEKNNELNNFDITCLEKAVSDKNGFAEIYDPVGDHQYAASLNQNREFRNFEVKSATVETITLDHFIESTNLDKIDLMKIDVERYEPEVLEGFKSNITKFQPSIIVEVLDAKIGKRINSIIKGVDYLYFNINEQGNIVRVDSIEASDSYNHLICKSTVAQSLKLI